MTRINNWSERTACPERSLTKASFLFFCLGRRVLKKWNLNRSYYEIYKLTPVRPGVGVCEVSDRSLTGSLFLLYAITHTHTHTHTHTRRHRNICIACDLLSACREAAVLVTLTHWPAGLEKWNGFTAPLFSAFIASLLLHSAASSVCVCVCVCV